MSSRYHARWAQIKGEEGFRGPPRKLVLVEVTYEVPFDMPEDQALLTARDHVSEVLFHNDPAALVVEATYVTTTRPPVAEEEEREEHDEEEGR